MVQKFLFNILSLKCCFRLLQLCLNTLNHGVYPKQAKKKPDKAFEHCFFSILKVFLNLTHNFGKFLESKVITFYVNVIIVDSVESETSGTTRGKNRTTFFLPNWAKWEEWLLLFFFILFPTWVKSTEEKLGSELVCQNIVSNFGPTGQTDESRLPSLNILVRLNWNRPFHLPCNRNFWNF